MGKTSNQTLKELKDAIEQINENIIEMKTTIKQNHQEVISKIEKVEKKTEEALILAKQNETEINNINKDYNEFKKHCNPDLINNLTDHINKLEAQVRGTLMEIDDLRNRSMRNTLIFRNLPEENNETWEDTCGLLGSYIYSKLNLPYDQDTIDSQISRAHRGSEEKKSRNVVEDSNPRQGPKPVFAQFVNWRFAEEVKAGIIKLNAQKRTNVTVNNMYSKELTARKNEALKRRREMIKNNKNIHVRLDYPAMLKSKKKGTRENWVTVENF